MLMDVLVVFSQIFRKPLEKMPDKMEHYKIWRITSDWFKTYVDNRMRDTSTEKVTSSQILMAYGVLQGSVF